MFEPGKKWYELDPSEIHASGYALIGLKDGLNPLTRKPAIRYDEIDTLPISPEWKDDLKHKYHYYYATYEAPEVLGYLCSVALGAFFALKQIGVI